MMEILQKEKRIIGLDIDENFVVATSLINRAKKIYLDKYAVRSSLFELLKDPYFKGSSVVMNLPAQTVLFRSFHLAPVLLKGKNKQQEILAFLSRQSLPFKLEDCFWDTFIMNSNLNLIAARKEVVEKYIAQVQDLGLRVSAVTASLIALYNVLIYTYPERDRDRSILLNIKTTSSDILIYEGNRLWLYPLSMGKRNLSETSDDIERFSIEIQRIFNSHYLQNPLAQKMASHFYLSGQLCPELLSPVLKNILSDFEIKVFQPLEKIGLLTKEPSLDSQVMSLSLGLGLTYLKIPLGLEINLIEAKIKKEQHSASLDILKKASFFFAVLVALYVLFLDIKLINHLKKQVSIFKNNQVQISSILPDIKALKEEKEKLQKLEYFLQEKLDQQGFYLRALAMISASKPITIIIKEVDAQMKEVGLEVVLSGSARNYEDINVFLSELKKNKDITEVKVVASTFPALETEVKEIDFKLRFEVPGSRAKGQNISTYRTISKPKEVAGSNKK